MKPFKIGIIGGGRKSAVGRAHLAAMRMDGRWEPVVGCFSRDHAENAASGDMYGVLAMDHGAPQRSANVGHLDAIVVLTPTPDHYQEVRDLLNAGVPVVCEKALATCSFQAKSLGDLGGFLAVIYNYSGYPAVRAMREVYRRGAIGKLTHFVAEMPQEGYALEGAIPQKWRRFERDGLPMIHLDLTVHLHQLLRYVCDVHPHSVIADECGYSPIGCVDYATALLRCHEPNNPVCQIRGQMFVSKTSLGDSNGLRLRLYGTEGSMEWYQQHPDEFRYATNDHYGMKLLSQRSEPEWPAGRFKAGHPTGFVEALGTLYSDIADCLQQYKETGAWQSQEVFGAALAEEGLRLCEAIHRSAQSGNWEEV
ncbi:MAG: Gfo/Idh/MocA family oxidoreductase [Proteobacteria bacterium]|nr:Gfo/Idh/MocA family oxidoreductase [Pseudomonadota bacterium]